MQATWVTNEPALPLPTLNSGHEIVHRLQDEDWGVRRFFLRTSAGHVVNVLSHRGRTALVSRATLPTTGACAAPPIRWLERTMTQASSGYCPYPQYL